MSRENEIEAVGIGPSAEPEGTAVGFIGGAGPSSPVQSPFEEWMGGPLAAPGPWYPKTLADFEWVLARKAEAEAEVAEVERQEKAAVDAIRARGAAIKAGPQREAGWWTSLAETWAKTNRDEVVRGKKKTRSFLSGSVAFRATAERLEVEDEAAVKAWLASLPEGSPLVRIKREPVMAEVQAQFQATGEIPPGFKHTPEGETLKVTAVALPSLTAKES